MTDTDVAGPSASVGAVAESGDVVRMGADGILVAPDSPEQLPSFADAFGQLARRWSGSPAVDDGVRRITYAELDAESRAIAWALRADGLGRDAPVAVLTEVATSSVIALLGVFRSGRPVVVLDRSIPVARLRTIMELSGAVEIVADDPSRELALQVAERSLRVRTIGELQVSAEPAGELPSIDPYALAAIIFTSGSTGKPKGVKWSQRFLSAEMFGTAVGMGYGVGERVALLLPISFAWGMGMVVVALSRGACIHLIDPRRGDLAGLIEWLRSERITVLPTTPSLLRNMRQAIEPGEQLPDMRFFSTAGEALYAADVVAAREFLPQEAVFVQVFGSSEGGGITTLQLRAGDELPSGAIPAGRAIRWRHPRVVDESGAEVAPGVPGELVVRTSVVADGYWRDPEQSARRFVRREDGDWDVHTGDMASLDEDGMLRLLGRAEAAVKVRGYLVDPSEIEASLLASGRVREAVVIPTTQGGRTELIAYFVPTRSIGDVSVATLRGWVAQRLPIWMVPRYLVPLAEMPKNERGKVDRQSLPPVPTREPSSPEGPLESQLADIWSGVLHIADIGHEDDFLELGGDSLDVEAMLARVEQELGLTFLTSDFMQATRLADFTRLVEGSVPAAEPSPWPGTQVKLRQGSSGRTVFCVAGGGGSALYFTPLARSLAPTDSVIVLQGRGVARRAPAEWSISGMARRRIAKVRAVQPEGPYFLVGHSMGAVIVLEMARRLRADGHEVTAFLIDPFFGSSTTPTRDALKLLAGGDISGNWFSRDGARRLARYAMVPAAGLLPARLSTRHHLMFRQSVLATHGHQAQPWDGRAVAYRTNDNSDSADLWEFLMPNATMKLLPCTHNASLHQPFVQEIAADVIASMGEARG